MADVKISDLPLQPAPIAADVFPIVHGGATEKATIGSALAISLGWYDSSAWASINAAVAAIGATSTTLVVSTDETLTANLTIPAKLSLIILKGGMITKASTYTLTINGPFEAGLYQVFSGFDAGDVTFGEGAVKEMLAEWWGAGDGITVDSTLAFSSAILASDYGIGGYGIPIKLQYSNYYVDYLELLNRTQILGSGFDVSRFTRNASSTTGHFIRMKSGQNAQRLRLANFYVDCDNIGADLDGINLGTETLGTTDYAIGSTIDTIYVTNASGYGFNLYVNASEGRNLWTAGCKVGFYLQGVNFYGYNLNAETSVNEDIIIAAKNSVIFGIHTEGDGTTDVTKDCIHVKIKNISIYGAYSNHSVACARRSVVGTEAGANGLIVENVKVEGEGVINLIHDGAISGIVIPAPATAADSESLPRFINSAIGEYGYNSNVHVGFVWDPGNLIDGTGETSAEISMTDAAFGDYVLVSAPYSLQGINCTGYVSQAGKIQIRLQNETGGAIDLASGTWRAKIIKGYNP